MSQRPKIEKRKFVSHVVDKTIQKIKSACADPELANLFENCFPNTLDTTVKYTPHSDNPDTFIITGDIEAMWLRDSTAQVWPYLAYLNEDEELKNMLKGLINRQFHCIQIDPYANAFNESDTNKGWQADLTSMKPEVFERKWEIDSLCYPVRLVYNYWKITGDTSCFKEDWQETSGTILRTLREQQRKENRGPYKFGRVTAWSTDTVPGNGYGNPINPVGLIATVFRPSDDAAIYPFNIPENFFAVSALRQLAEIHRSVYNDNEFASSCEQLAEEVKTAIYDYAVFEHPEYGKILAYEVDGFGNQLFMDDANIPSLLALPYLGCIDSVDPIYLNTRNFILSRNNPYFFSGSSAEGIGSPHTLVNNIWPLSIVMRALTSSDESEIVLCIKYLLTNHAGKGFMHESFDKDDPSNYTRDWFAWANSLFGELIVKLYEEHPEILKTKSILTI